jgi:4-amino-4-deoxy-L-arabinose transferase-like glycosyltransferase
VRSLFRRGPGGSPVAWTATALFLALMTFWTIVTPNFRNPDEPQHVNSVLRLAEGGGWPEPGDAYVMPEVLRAKTLTGFSAVDGQYGPWIGGTLLPGVRETLPPEDLQFFALFSTRPVTPAAERLPFPELELTEDVSEGMHGDQMTQHPPLYYAVSAAVVTVTGALDWPFDRTLLLMRLVSVLMVGFLPLMAFAVTRRLTGNRSLADMAALLPLAIPQLASIGGSVSNDALVILFGGLLVVLLARVLTGDRSWRTYLLTGGVLGLALLTKGTLLPMVPVVGAAVVIGARRAHDAVPPLAWVPALVRLAAVWGLAFVIGGWWWALNILRYGAVQPDGLPDSVIPTDAARASLLDFSGMFWRRTSGTFWGTFGQLELPLNGIVATVLSAVLVVAVALAWRRRGLRTVQLVLLSFVLLTLIGLFATTYSAHLENGRFAGMQGRYLFGGLVAVFAAVAIGIGSLGREGGRLQRWLPVITLPLVLLVAVYGLLVAFDGFYIDDGWTPTDAWQRMVDWSAAPSWGALGLVVVLVLLSLVTFGLTVRNALRRDGGGEPDDGTATDPSTRPEPAAVGADTP